MKFLLDRKRLFLFCTISLFLVSGCTTLGDKPVYQQSGVAIRGYDPVVYFDLNKAMQGEPEFSVRYQNAIWYFISEKNRTRFTDNPEHFLPEYGGYCAYAMSFGLVVSSDPEAFSIINDRLYLNYSKSVRKKWLKNTVGFIQDANKHWSGKQSVRTD